MTRSGGSGDWVSSRRTFFTNRAGLRARTPWPIKSSMSDRSRDKKGLMLVAAQAPRGVVPSMSALTRVSMSSLAMDWIVRSPNCSTNGRRLLV